MNENIIITGSSGLVGQYLVPLLSKNYNLITIDRVPSDHTNIVSCISCSTILNNLSKDESYSIIHLAASRFDFGISSQEYFEENVNHTKLFIENIKNFNINYFLHYSSVAVFQGQNIPFTDRLNCDDAYRSTKFIQSKIIEEYCLINNIMFCALLPSAIHSEQKRNDTNIGKLKNLSNIIPFVPRINVLKSLTQLDHLCKFTEFVLSVKKTGKYMVTDFPTKTVTNIIIDYSGKNKICILIPYLQNILYLLAFVLTLLKFKYLTVNRVKKLFSDTSYDSYKESYNYDTYKIFLESINE